MENPGNLMHKAAAIVFAVMRWVLSWTLRPSTNCFSSSPSDSMVQQTPSGDLRERLSKSCDTCAVCLNQLRKRDQVRELGNCCHVFHRLCIDTWIDHGYNKTCPLCRAPLLTSTRLGSQPSWAVERLLYLFGDDLLIWRHCLVLWMTKKENWEFHYDRSREKEIKYLFLLSLLALAFYK